MKYCADTWFILALYGADETAKRILHDVKEGKTRLIIPIVVYSESWKKLLQKGISENDIERFYGSLLSSERIQIAMMDSTIAKEAAKISLHASIPLIDSMVAATCRLTDCHVLLSGDSDYIILQKKKYLKVQSW